MMTYEFNEIHDQITDNDIQQSNQDGQYECCEVFLVTIVIFVVLLAKFFVLELLFTITLVDTTTSN